MSRSNNESGYKDRVKRLSERLSGMQSALDSEKSSICLDIEKKLNQLENEFNEAYALSNRKFSTLKDQLIKLENAVTNEQETREVIYQQKILEIAEFQGKIHDAFIKSQKLKKENEGKIYKSIDDKVEGVRLRLVEENKNLKQTEGEFKECFEQDIPKLYEFVQGCIDDRKEMEESLDKRMETGLLEVENALSIETKTREETEEAMLAMLKDVVSRIKNDLEIERRERENSEETLLGLLEETCSKLGAVTNY